MLFFPITGDDIGDERLNRDKARVFFSLFVDRMLHRAGEEFYEMYKAREDLLSAESSPVVLPKKRKAEEEEGEEETSPPSCMASLSPPPSAVSPSRGSTTSPERSSSEGERSPESKIPPTSAHNEVNFQPPPPPTDNNLYADVSAFNYRAKYNLYRSGDGGGDGSSSSASGGFMMMRDRDHAATSARETLLRMAGNRSNCKSCLNSKRRLASSYPLIRTGKGSVYVFIY